MSLFKYVVPERIDILQNACIRFSQVAALNDPFEMQPHFELFAEDNTVREMFYTNSDFSNGFETGVSVVRELLGQFENMLPNEQSKSKWKDTINNLPPLEVLEKQVQEEYPEWVEFLISMTKNSMPLLKGVVYSKMNETLGVLSLTEKHNNILMWAHYANNYKGFVIEFDERHEFFSQQRFPEETFAGLKKVEYSDVRPSHQFMSEITPKEMFLIKSKEWEYEQEWRMIASLAEAIANLDKVEKPILDPDGLPVILSPIPLDCITGIIFGSRMTEENRKKISNLLSSYKRYSHIKKYESVLDEKTFTLHTQRRA